MELGARIIFRFDNGVVITESVCWAVIVVAALCIAMPLLARNLKRDPKGKQGVAELCVDFIYNFVKNNMGEKNLVFAPFIGTILLYLVVVDALGLLGIRAVTADLNGTFAIGVLVFIVMQSVSIKRKGLLGYFKHFVEPTPMMITTNLLEDVTFVLSLCFRIFGNILAGVIIMELVMHFLEWLSMEVVKLPIPLFQFFIPLPLNFFFDIFEAVLQAYVFSILCMTSIARATALHGEE